MLNFWIFFFIETGEFCGLVSLGSALGMNTLCCHVEVISHPFSAGLCAEATHTICSNLSACKLLDQHSPPCTDAQKHRSTLAHTPIPPSLLDTRRSSFYHHAGLLCISETSPRKLTRTASAPLSRGSTIQLVPGLAHSKFGRCH